MPKPKFTGKKIQPAWTKHARKAIPDQANIVSIGQKRQDGNRMLKYPTKQGKVIRATLLEPVAHKTAKLPAEVMEAIGEKIPKSATGLQITKKGKKFRILYNVKGTAYQVFIWQKKEKEFKVYPTQKLDVTRITKADPTIRSRTVKKTIVE